AEDRAEDDQQDDRQEEVEDRGLAVAEELLELHADAQPTERPRVRQRPLLQRRHLGHRSPSPADRVGSVPLAASPMRCRYASSRLGRVTASSGTSPPNCSASRCTTLVGWPLSSWWVAPSCDQLTTAV